MAKVRGAPGSSTADSRLYLSRDVNIMDNMINLIERHTDNLEELVEDRTKQLLEEKKKTDKLLYKILPRYRLSFKGNDLSSVFVLSTETTQCKFRD